MKIIVNNVEGSTARKGAKQNKVYTIISQGSKQTLMPKGDFADLSMFYTATDGKREFQLWDVHRNWTLLGISKAARGRYTYTKNFTVIPD